MIHKIIITLLIIGLTPLLIEAQTLAHDINNWPGKDGKLKSSIEISKDFINDLDAVISKGSRDTLTFIKIPLSTADKIKSGQILIWVSTSVEKAQEGLLTEFINGSTHPIKPSLLEDDDYNIGDIAFIKADKDITSIGYYQE